MPTTRFTLICGLLLALYACSAPGEPQHPTLATGLSPAACVAAAAAGTDPDAARCPAYLRSAVADARATCSEAGGRLEGADQAEVWQLDVDDDGQDEVAFEMNGNVTCVDAYSLFECGSLGCPKTLYTNSGGAWEAIGDLFAFGPESVDVTDQRIGGHRTLRACRDGPPCVEFWFYEWRGGQYERTRLDVRGFPVDFANTAHGLRPLLAETDLKAMPSAQAESVGRYEAGTDVAIIGTTTNGFYYVSPCNACVSGFVPTSGVRPQ
ncbi:MAG TPA: hypothetical protein VHH11_12340 [Gammaproteobacteria bacterium]|nr:hypothetical protein [Gammaproteobacteria bacterium]